MVNRITYAIGSFFLDIIETVVIALSIFLIVYLFIMQPHQVNGSSMFPSYIDGEYLLTDKISYKMGLPKRGDVIVFRAPQAAECPEGTGCDFIKRIIGLPGETVDIRSNQVYINGQLLVEAYLPSDTITRQGNYTDAGAVVVPPDSYIVMGDNREHSSDSRAWGPVAKDLIVGKVFFRYWPPSQMGQVPAVSYANF